MVPLVQAKVLPAAPASGAAPNTGARTAEVFAVQWRLAGSIRTIEDINDGSQAGTAR